ncbi:hypothetical protein J3P88_20945 [Pseudomonas sp. Z3-6]|uniref:hypothetical protein n=1 Tax=Pseudomonas sp. Z3-6 TaxID=2817411 RepID=UPI003DA9A6AE
MPNTIGMFINTAVGAERFCKNDLSRDPNRLFIRSELPSPLVEAEQISPEFDLDRNQEKFAAGWKCISLFDTEGSVDGEGVFFGEGLESNDRKVFLNRLYEESVCEGFGVKREIGCEALRQAQEISAKLDSVISKQQIVDNQFFCMDSSTLQGIAYLHSRDMPYEKLLTDSERDINVFLPGYATGDRYSLIFAALVEPRLKISIAYTEGDAKEKASAEEAARVVEKALSVNGEFDPSRRVSVLSYKGGSLKQARESLDEGETRAGFSHQSGFLSPLSNSTDKTEHVFHVSATTEILNRYFRNEDGLGKDKKHSEIREKLSKLVSLTDKVVIDSLVNSVVEHQEIKEGAIALWIADREYANEREAEAISRPFMFELIADALEKEGKDVYLVADTYLNRAKNENGTEVWMNRQPFRPSARPHIGQFWSAEVDGERLLAPRENQWYFMDRLLQRTGGGLIGIRSGALEPFALMGHNIIYLEHKNMFTPERHASWQGGIPYNRLIVENTTGYLKGNTEVVLNNLIRENLSRVVGGKKLTDSDRSQVRDVQGRIGSIQDDLREGQISGQELQLLVAMVDGGTAIDAAMRVWGKDSISYPSKS